MISGTFKTETVDGIKRVTVTINGPGFRGVKVNQESMGETESATHKAVREAFESFQALNGITDDAALSRSEGYFPLGAASR